ncbi:NAD-dependent epimerase/dehydratase family protein [Arthrobacter sp. B1I2]|uniref:NAD-dependent epimerase/dehydratase family protein n=1 Tax=Arthrobacter sp. B1I2 TaxID=3042263 RepID=UPI0027849C73|nr:NAD(P)-dependent oxidoreductase [Arthrobacter sp. B1I2]MDQ0733449.1 UDP-glucose 4-epimerase [Arthrobacter sp. B1I2]
MTTIVFGAAGFVGVNIVRQLLLDGEEVIMADVFEPDKLVWDFLPNQGQGAKFVFVDTRNRTQVRDAVGALDIDRAVIAAALTPLTLDTERDRFLEAVDVNLVGTVNALDAVRAAGVGRIVFISSETVYGHHDEMTPVTEDISRGKSFSLYDITKYAGEALCLRYAEIHGLDLVSARLCAPYGPMERDNGSRPVTSLPALLVREAREGRPLRLPAQEIPDRAHVFDVAAAVSALLFAQELSHRTYNVGAGRPVTGDDIAAAVQKIYGERPVERLPVDPQSRLLHGVLVTDRLEADTGWRPQFDIDSGVAQYADWVEACQHRINRP